MLNIIELCEKDAKSTDKFINNIDWLVTEDKKSSFSSLSEPQKEEAVALLIAALEDPAEWFINLDDLDAIVRSLAKFMMTGKSEHRDYAMTLFKANALKHFANFIDDLISTRHQEHQANIRNLRRPLTINSLRIAI